MPKVVIDANVFISGLLCDGIPRRLIELLERGSYELFYSAQLILELYKTQTRKKLADRIKPERLAGLIELIEDKGVLINVSSSPAVSRDPEDDEYVECALISNCEYIVTGDDDLLTLQQHKSVKIVTPRQFFDLLSVSIDPIE